MLLQQAINFVSLFLVTALIVRNLPRSEYGELSLVLSYGVIFNLINISVSSILLRDYPQLDQSAISRYKNSFDIFNYFKSFLAIIITLLISWYFINKYNNRILIIVLLINSSAIICQYFTDPFQVFLSVSFRQNIITRIVTITSLFNMLSTLGIFYFPSIIFVVSKNLAVNVVAYLLMKYYFEHYFACETKISHRSSLNLLLKNLSDFSIWTHLQGIFTDIIYRADILILGWIGTSFQILGNYNVALQLANMTKIIPQIFQYHTTLCVSNMKNNKNQQNEMIHTFLKINFMISLIIMAGYLIMGKFIISLIAKTMHEEIFEYGLYIIGGLCIFNFLRPLVAYAIVAHSVKQCVLYVNLPATIFALAAYVGGGIFYGVHGVLIANVAIGLMLCILTIFYINTKTSYRWSFSLITDYERKFLREIWLKTVCNRT
jgi:O-antigen/teichoic acid export membrane protein